MNLDDIRKMEWPELVTAMDKQFMLVVSSPDPALREAAVLVKNHGTKAGAAYLATVLVAMKGPALAISEGVRIYEEIVEKHDIPKLRDEVVEMSSWTAWAGIPFPKNSRRNTDWPIPIPRKELIKNGGYANFLLFEGVTRFEPETNTQHLAANGVYNFLKWMMGLDGGLRSLRKKPVRKAA